MRTAAASRFLQATLPQVQRLLTPAAVIEYEGTFTVVDVTESDGGAVVTGRGGGRLLEVQFAFEERADGYVYHQVGDAGPFEELTTCIRLSRRDEGVEVTMRSSVSLNLPVPFADRVAAWKRRGELRRALAALAADAE